MRPQLDVAVCLRTRSTASRETEFDRLQWRWPTRVVERRFLGELIALENRLSRGYGDGQVPAHGIVVLMVRTR